MNNDIILKIIHDFDAKAITDFFDLKEYETDYEISRHFVKWLRIGYIKKEERNNPRKAIYINFKRKYFSISVFSKSMIMEKEIFRDYYQNYNTNEEVYQKLLSICENKDFAYR